MIENLHGYTVDETGEVVVSVGRLHNGMDYNCTDFAYLIERFAIEVCGAELVPLNENSTYVPGRNYTPSDQKNWRQRIADNVYNRFFMMGADMVLSAFLSIPVLNKKLGTGITDEIFAENIEIKYHEELSDSDVEVIENFVSQSPKGSRHPRVKYVAFPRRVRIDQLYSKRLSEYSARLMTY